MKWSLLWPATFLLPLAFGIVGCGGSPQPASNVSGPGTRKDDAPPVASRQDVEADLKAAAEQAVAAQRECSEKFAMPVEITNRFGMKFALIPPGEFLMGSPDSDSDAKDNEKPQHKVQITEPFYLGVHEVTEAQYERVILGDPNHSPQGSFERDTSSHPVRMINWEHAAEFCARLSALEGQKYRLPTEAEWEYACRGGTTTKWYSGDGEADLGRVAWYRDNSGGMVHPVGAKIANAWGLFDMHGSVTEWCQDLYADYECDAATIRDVSPKARQRVYRGGNFKGIAWSCRAAIRYGSGERNFSRLNGFRVATAPSETAELSADGAVTQPDGSKVTVSGPRVWSEPEAAKLAAAAQEECSRKLAAPVEVTNSVGMRFRLIPPGEFQMGSPDSASAAKLPERPQHAVRLTKPFYLCIHEVTVGQFRQFVDATAYQTEAERNGKGGMGWNEATRKWKGPDPKCNWRNTGFPGTDEHPVVNVTWNDAVAFCTWLGRKEGQEYRLPTEAEWEYACRAGTTTRYYCGDDAEMLVHMANVADGTARKKLEDGHPPLYLISRDGYPFTAPVGSFRANGFGLYDMHGNAAEWCQDWFGKEYYEESPVEDPPGSQSGPNRVARGGGWLYSVWSCRSAYRSGYKPDAAWFYVGFRPVLAPADPSDG